MKAQLRNAPLDVEIKILDIEGRIDDYTYTNLADEIHTLLNIGSNKIVCNFNLVEYIGAAGLQVFVELIQQARRNGGDIKLCCLPSHVQKKFAFAGFDEISPFYQEVNDAVQEWQEIQPQNSQEWELSGGDAYAKTSVVTAVEVVSPAGEEDLRAPTVQVKPSQADETKDFTPAVTSSRDRQQKISREMEQTIYARIATLRQTELQNKGQAEQQTKCFSYAVNYCIQEKLSDGFASKTYRGEERSCYGFSRPVILKYIRSDYAQNKEKMSFLMRELHKVFGIQHQNIATMYKIVCWDNYYFVVNEYIHGIGLDQAMSQTGKGKRPFPPTIACYIVYQICNALAYANRRADEEGTQVEIVHGKIYPANIMISKEGDAKLLNLGLAKVNTIFHIQQPGAWKKMSNLFYLAPEVLSSGMPCKSGDIFALGVVFYELLTGRLPFAADQLTSQYLGMPLPPSHFQPRINDIMDKIVLRCLLPEPERRFSDFQDMALQLEDMLYEKGLCFVQATFAKFLENYGFFAEK